MQYHDNTLAVEVSWLEQQGIISESNVRQLAKRQNIRVVRRGCANTPALVAYESIPERFRRLIEAKVGNPYNIVKVNQVESHIKPNPEASKLYETFRLPDGRFLKSETQREYYANAIVLDAIHRLISDKKAKRAALGHRASRAWEQIAEGVMELDRTKYPHNLPSNPRRLEDKYKQYMHEGPECLIHKNFMNKSAAKVDDDVKESVIMEMISDPRNFDNEQVRAIYNQFAEKMEWKKITAATVAIWRDKFDMVSYAGRRGSVALSNKKAMQVKRSAPSAPLYYLTIDGWDVELRYKKTVLDSQGHSITSYHHRPTIVVVLDASQKYPLGFAVGTHETPELITSALRNAIRHTQELFGSMYRAHQIQSDRYAIKQMTPLYECIAEKSTPARAKNAKAKVIEPYFHRLNKMYCQMMPNWSGFGITSDRDKQPNVEFLDKYKNDFPDFEGVCRQLEFIIAKERAEKREKFIEAFKALPESAKLELPAASYLYYFGERTVKPSLLYGSGLHPTIGGIERDYDCFDPSFREHYAVKWFTMYDPDDMTQVLAVNENGTLRYLLQDKYVQPMALRDRKPGDSDQLQLVRNFNKALEEKVIETRANAAEIVRATIAENPALEETTLRKLMITDSRGQHKNQLGEAKKALPSSSRRQENDTTEETFFDMY